MKKKDIIEIEGITINIGDTSVKVTPLQAKELFNALKSLLGEGQTTYYPYYPYYPYTPITPTTPTWWYTGTTNVLCLDTDSTAQMTATDGSSTITIQ